MLNDISTLLRVAEQPPDQNKFFDGQSFVAHKKIKNGRFILPLPG